MTDEELNVEISAWLGEEWERTGSWPFEWRRNGIKVCHTLQPTDYAGDLNHVYKLEEWLSECDRQRYRFFLCEMLEVPTATKDGWRVIHATPRQKAEAWLKAVGCKAPCPGV